MSIRGHVGRCAIVPAELAGANITQDTARFAITPECDANYLMWCLRSTETQRWMMRHVKGVAVKGINLGDVKQIPVPLPPLAEQRRIAAVLDAAEALRAKRRAALAKLDSLTQAIFFDMFGDPAEKPQKWPVRELSEVVLKGTIVTYGIVQAGDEIPGGVPYIRTGDISNGEILVDELRRTSPEIAAKFDRSKVRTGEIVMSIRATVGTTAIVPAGIDGANLTQGTARIAPGADTANLYLLHCLRAPGTQAWIQRQVKGATFREITLSRLRQLPIPLPPRSLQERFVEVAMCIEQMRTTFDSSSTKLESLFASLQHRAFRSEL